MIKKCLGLIVGLLLLTGCSEFALLSSGSSLALSNNVYAKAYSGVDLTTYLTTNKDIAKHLNLPPVKLHCSMLAEDAIKSAIKDFEKNSK